MTDVNARIDAEVKNNDVVLFMKGTPQFPMCGFSGQVAQILGYIGVPYKGVNVLEDQEIREFITKNFSIEVDKDHSPDKLRRDIGLLTRREGG